MRRLRAAGTIRSNLTRIMIGALFPMLFLGAWQGLLTYEDSRNLVAQRLRANAWAIAESERDPFIIARHSLQMASQLDVVRRFGDDCDQMLLNARNGATGVVNFIRSDRHGRVRCSGMRFEQGLSIASNPWWQQARLRNSFLLGGPVIGEVSKRPIVLLLLPIRDAAGQFDGAISAGINLERLAAALSARQRERGGAVLLVDGNGKVLLSAAPSRFDTVAAVKQGLQTPQMAQSADGKHWTFVSAPLFDRDLMVVYAEPRANFTNAAVSRIWLILALPLLAAALSLAGVWLATQRYLLDWFPRLHRLTQRIADQQPVGNASDFARAPTEIAHMADDLHEMAGALTSNREALQRALEMQKSLTRELNHRVRNNIQIIVSLLTMQAEKIPQGWVRDILEQARARVSAMGLTHRFIYDQEEGQIGSVAIAQLLLDLCAQIRCSGSRADDLQLDCDVEAECTVDFDRAVPLMLFALEAISIAVRRGKGSGDGRAVVTVRLRAEAGSCLLEVRDHFPEACSIIGDRELLDALAEQVGGEWGADYTDDNHFTWLRFVAK